MLTITAACSVVCQLCQIIGFQLDTIQLFVTSQSLNLGLCRRFIHDHIAIFILGKFIEQIFFGEFLTIFLFCSEIFGNGKSRHDRRIIDRIKLYLIAYIASIRQCFGHIGKHFVHFFTGFHPLLFGIKHTVRIVQILTRTQTD